MRHNWEIYQVNVKSTYLYGELNEDEVIYMKPPPGNICICDDKHVLRFLKALYGLKQSRQWWYQVLQNILTNLGLIWSKHNHTLFFKWDKNTLTTILLAHVNDFTIMTVTPALIQAMKDGLQKHLNIHNMGEIHWMLGLEIKRNQDLWTISLSQHSNIDSIITCHSFEDAKPLSIPIVANSTLSHNDCPSTTSDIGKMAGHPYHKAIGSLMYAAIGTQPNISFAVGQVACFSDNPGQPHWEAVKCTFCYLKGTRDYWLVYGKNGPSISSYTDADRMSNEDQHAISGYAFLIDRGAISWSSKQQSIVTLSTTEAEYIAATHAAKEAIWLREFISKVYHPQNPMSLHSDSQSAIALAQNEQFHAQTKHINIHFNFIHYIIEAGKSSLTTALLKIWLQTP